MSSKTLKIRIENERHSKVIQELFFGMNFRWDVEQDYPNPRHTEKPYLYFKLGENRIMYGKSAGHFTKDSSDEIKLAHPLQLEYLKKIKIGKAILMDIVELGYYYVRDRKYLNSLL